MSREVDRWIWMAEMRMTTMKAAGRKLHNATGIDDRWIASWGNYAYADGDYE